MKQDRRHGEIGVVRALTRLGACLTFARALSGTAGEPADAASARCANPVTTRKGSSVSTQRSNEAPMRPPIVAGAILIGIFIALSLAAGAVVHVVSLVRAADVAGASGSFASPRDAPSSDLA